MANAPTGAALVWCFKDPSPKVAVVSISKMAGHGKKGFVLPGPKNVVEVNWGSTKKTKHPVMILEVEYGNTVVATKTLNDKLAEFGTSAYSKLGEEYVEDSNVQTSTIQEKDTREDGMGEDENVGGESLPTSSVVECTADKGTKRAAMDVAVESAVKKMKGDLLLANNECFNAHIRTHNEEHESLFKGQNNLEAELQKVQEAMQEANKLLNDRITKLETNPPARIIQTSRGFTYTEALDEVAQARQAAQLLAAVEHRGTWGKAVSEATRELLDKEERLTCVVTDPSRSQDKSKPRLDQKKVQLIRDMVKLYCAKKGLKGGDVPKPGAIGESISSVLAYDRRNSNKKDDKNPGPSP